MAIWTRQAIFNSSPWFSGLWDNLCTEIAFSDQGHHFVCCFTFPFLLAPNAQSTMGNVDGTNSIIILPRRGWWLRQTLISLGSHFVCSFGRSSQPSTFDLIGCFVVMVKCSAMHIFTVCEWRSPSHIHTSCISTGSSLRHIWLSLDIHLLQLLVVELRTLKTNPEILIRILPNLCGSNVWRQLSIAAQHWKLPLPRR